MREQKFDLEERTFNFALNCRKAVKAIDLDITTNSDCRQLIRSSGSVGANYIEANEALSRKDFIYRIKVCRKEVKESDYWLRLIQSSSESNYQNDIERLREEAIQLIKIFSAIIRSSDK